MSESTETTTTEAAAPVASAAVAPKKERKPRGKVTVDVKNMRVTLMPAPGATEAPFVGTLDGMPDAVMHHLALRQLGMMLQSSADRPKVLSQLVAGRLPGVGRSSSAAVDSGGLTNLKRQAIAHALVEITKEGNGPLTYDDAASRAANLKAKDVDSYLKEPTVLKHLYRLDPSKRPNLASLAEAA